MSQFQWQSRKIQPGTGEIRIDRKHALEGNRGAIGLAGVEGGGAEDIIKVDVACALGFQRLKQGKGLRRLALGHELLGAVHDLVGPCRRSKASQRDDDYLDPDS